MSKKQEMLEKLLKAQKEGKLNNHIVIAKVEAIPEAAFEDIEPLKKKSDKNIIHDISIEDHKSALKEQSGQDLPHATHDMISHSFHHATEWDEPNRMAQLAAEHGAKGHKVHVSQHEGGNLMTVWKPKKGKKE